MPELPEVETVSLALSKVVTNAKILKTEIFRNDLRWNIKKSLKKDLHNDFFKKPFRRGKYILVPTNKDNILLIHLGMSGQIKIRDNFETLLKHDHVRIKIKSNKDKIYFIIVRFYCNSYMIMFKKSFKVVPNFNLSTHT